MIDRNLAPLRSGSAAKSKAGRELDDPSKLLRGDVDNGVSFLHLSRRYSTATLDKSSAAAPALTWHHYSSSMSLGSKIKKARNDAKLTQEQAAEALNITKGAVSQWEQNATTPTLNQFRAFCALTHTSADELLLNKKLHGLEKRIAALPEALYEYVVIALELAEEAKNKIPKQFLTPPTKQTYQPFHEYLLSLSESLKQK